MKRPVAVVSVLVLVISVLVGAFFVNVSKAFVYHIHDPAIVKIDSPIQNGICSSNNITISGSVKLPYENWEILCVNLTLYLDGLRSRADAQETNKQGSIFTFNLSLNVWKEGHHNLTTIADISCKPPDSSIYLDYDYRASGDSVVYFELRTLTVMVTSIENKTYNTADLPLDFVVSKPFLPKIAYSLDYQANMTIAGNATLNGLSNGTHNVTVYAWDDAGNVGASETVTFTVNVPDAEPFPTTLIAAAAAVIVAVASFGLAAYFLRRRGKGE